MGERVVGLIGVGAAAAAATIADIKTVQFKLVQIYKGKCIEWVFRCVHVWNLNIMQ